MIGDEKNSREDELLKDILEYAREAATAHAEVPVAKQIDHIEKLLVSAMGRIPK